MTPPLKLQMDLRVAVLQAVFTEIATRRMAGLPLCHPGLAVEALGFEPMRLADAQASGLGAAADNHGLWVPALAIGVLVTPWFMNLVALPLRHDDHGDDVGSTRLLTLGGHRLAFIAAHEPALGRFAACSLFSPMQDFADAATARDVAMAVLDGLRGTPAEATAVVSPVPSRRGFLFGRGSAGRAAA